MALLGGGKWVDYSKHDLQVLQWPRGFCRTLFRRTIFGITQYNMKKVCVYCDRRGGRKRRARSLERGEPAGKHVFRVGPGREEGEEKAGSLGLGARASRQVAVFSRQVAAGRGVLGAGSGEGKGKSRNLESREQKWGGRERGAGFQSSVFSWQASAFGFRFFVRPDGGAVVRRSG